MKSIKKLTAFFTAFVIAVSCIAFGAAALDYKNITIGKSYTNDLKKDSTQHYFFETDKAGELTVKVGYTGKFICGALVGDDTSGGTVLIKPDSVKDSKGKSALLQLEEGSGFMVYSDEKSGCACTVKYTVKKGKYLLTLGNEAEESKYKSAGKVTLSTSLGKKSAAIDRLSVTVKKGSTLKLGAILTDGKAGSAKWSSSDKSVASVSSKGKVTAKKKGTAVITAKYGDSKVQITVKVE